MSKTGLTVCLLLLAGCYFKSATHETDELPAEGMDAEVGDSGETAADAGADAGGKDASADGSAPDAAVDAGPCGMCSADKPVCIEATKQCVACSDKKKGACTDTQVCDPIKAECVECLSNTDCKEPTASVCDTQTRTCKACADSSANDCDHITGKNVCAAGSCVQCTKDKFSACRTADDKPAVCEHSKKQCASAAVASAETCDACVSDAQCKTGNVCVEMSFGGASQGHYCQPLLLSTCDSQRPYAREVMNGATVDGQNKTYCTLAYTTCAAIQQKGSGYRSNCGVNGAGQPVAVGATAGRNELCGAQGINDGFCVNLGTGQYKCTVPCSPASDAVTRLAPDCPDVLGPTDPTCATQQHVGGQSGLLCTL